MSQKPEHLVALDVGNATTRLLVSEIPSGDMASARSPRAPSNGSSGWEIHHCCASSDTVRPKRKGGTKEIWLISVRLRPRSVM